VQKIGKVDNYAKTLENFFLPLFKVTNDPESDPKLAKLLENLSGFDSVDDESLADVRRRASEAFEPFEVPQALGPSNTP